MAASPYEHTLIETRIHIKQNRKTHKKDAKNSVYAQFRVLHETSDTSGNSYVNNILRSKMIHACKRIIIILLCIASMLCLSRIAVSSV